MMAKGFGAMLALLAAPGIPAAEAGFRSPESLVRKTLKLLREIALDHCLVSALGRASNVTVGPRQP
jgi:hypothetical protein